MHGTKCGLSCGTGTAVSHTEATVIHVVPAADPGKNRGHLVHLDLINSGSGNIEATVVFDGLTSTIVVPTKSVVHLDFFIVATASAQNVTAQGASAGITAVGYHEKW